LDKLNSNNQLSLAQVSIDWQKLLGNGCLHEVLLSEHKIVALVYEQIRDKTTAHASGSKTSTEIRG